MITKIPFGQTGHTSTRTLFGAAALGKVTQAEADQTLDVLLEYGINHIDTTTHNLLVAPDGELALIDWQYCSFTSPRDDRQLILAAAQFLRYTDLTSDLSDWMDWLRQLHTSCQPSVDWQSFSASVAGLQSMKRPPAADRLALTVDLPHRGRTDL